jgi:hypothetical protein
MTELPVIQLEEMSQIPYIVALHPKSIYIWKAKASPFKLEESQVFDEVDHPQLFVFVSDDFIAVGDYHGKIEIFKIHIDQSPCFSSIRSVQAHFKKITKMLSFRYILAHKSFRSL